MGALLYYREGNSACYRSTTTFGADKDSKLVMPYHMHIIKGLDQILRVSLGRAKSDA